MKSWKRQRKSQVAGKTIGAGRRARAAGLGMMAAVLGLAGYGLSAPTPPAAHAEPPRPVLDDSRRPVVAGASRVNPLYQQRCTRCHGADGKGSDLRETTPEMPDFTNPRWQARRSDAQLRASILEGRGIQMPGFRGKVSSSQAQELVAYVRGFVSRSASRAAEVARDFDTRLQELREELEALQRQTRKLAKPSAHPDGDRDHVPD